MGNLHSRYYGGNLVFYDAHRKRIVEAIGADVFKFQHDFMRGQGLSATALGDEATVTATGTSPAVYTDAAGGVLLLTTGGTENDGLNIQWLGENFHLGATGIRMLYFGCRFKISDATQSDFFIGLCDTDTDILASADDSIGFRKADGSTAVSFVTEKGGTETTVAAFTADTAWHIVEFFYDADAGTLEPFVDGASLGNIATTNLPDEEQRVSMQFLTGEGGAKTMSIDWINVFQIGGRNAA